MSVSHRKTPRVNLILSEASGNSSSAREARTPTALSQGRNPTVKCDRRDTFGVLKLTLRTVGYDWEFVPEAGKKFTDSGTGTCH
jgi:hypothetical protein